MKYSPEVLIYIQNVKNFFKSNETAREYYFIRYNEEEFYKEVAKISQSNFEKKGDAILNLEQFESLRFSDNELKKEQIISDEEYVIKTDKNIFINLEGYEKICLN